MNTLYKAALILIIIGALNWGLDLMCANEFS